MATVQHHSHLYGVLWNAKVDVKSSFCYPCRWSEVNQVSWPFECLKWAVIVRVAAHSPRYSWNPHRRASVLIVMKPTSTPTQLNPIWHLITNSLYCSLQRRCTTHTASYFIHTHTHTECLLHWDLASIPKDPQHSSSYVVAKLTPILQESGWRN